VIGHEAAGTPSAKLSLSSEPEASDFGEIVKENESEFIYYHGHPEKFFSASQGDIS
jgi:hypothetical protein